MGPSNLYLGYKLICVVHYLTADEQGDNSHNDDLLETPMPSTDTLNGDLGEVSTTQQQQQQQQLANETNATVINTQLCLCPCLRS